MCHLVAFGGNAKHAKHPEYIISRVGLPKKVFSKKYDCAQKSRKKVEIKDYSQAFRRPQGPCIEGHGMPRGDMGGYIMDSDGLNTTIMGPCRDCFGKS